MTLTGPPLRLAIIDDDAGFLRTLTQRVEAHRWPHRVLASPVPLPALVALRLDAVVINLVLLGPRGWGYLDQLSTDVPHLGVLVCTRRSSVAQRVRALRLGVDDWITKPCHPEELIARVEAVRRRRRCRQEPSSGPITAGEVEILAGQYQAAVAGTPLDLTRRELELLELLVGGEGQVLRHGEIYERVWGYAMPRGDRSVHVFVRKLRQKLESASPRWRYIHTHFGVGYRFQAEPIDAVGEDSATVDKRLVA